VGMVPSVVSIRLDVNILALAHTLINLVDSLFNWRESALTRMDIRVADIAHEIKHPPNHADQEGSHSTASSTGPDAQLEKGTECGASHTPIQDGEYVVTAKTWAVVLVGLTFWFI